MPDDPEDEQGSSERSGAGRPQRPSGLEALLSLDRRGFAEEVTEDHILSILFVRRGREAALGRELFSDPAWDILLELYAARLGRRTISLHEIAASIETPQSTTARWTRLLSERGLVTIDGAQGDPDRTLVQLSTEGEAAMTRLVAYWGSAFRSI